MPPSTTVVTMFFNLKNLPDANNAVRPPSFYVENGKDTLMLKYPMVIFCDEVTHEFVKKIRDEHVDSSIRTEYVVKNYIEYDYYKQNWTTIHENRKKSSGYKEPDNRNTVSYFLMGMFKPLALLLAKKIIPSSDYYAWIDLGCKHIVKNVSDYAPQMLDRPNPKISVCYIHYRSHNEIRSMKHYMAYGGACGIASTAYTVESAYIEPYYNSMFSVFHEMLLNGVGHTDETAMVYCYDRNPELFSIYYGDYYSIFTNYHSVTSDYHAVKHYFIMEALSKGRQDLAIQAARSVLNSKTLAISDTEVSFLNSIINQGP